MARRRSSRESGEFGLGGERLLPDAEAARNQRLAIRLPLQPRQQQKQLAVPGKNAERRDSAPVSER